MFELVVGLATLALIFLVTSLMVANRYMVLYEKVRELERYTEDLKFSVKTLRAENDRLHSLVYCNPEVEKMTALKLTVHLKNEEIADLREKVRKQNQLLKQKWEGSRKCG